MGIVLGIGLLLKNYFIPLALFVALSSIWQAYVRRQGGKRNTTALIAGMILAIMPWAIYVNSRPEEKRLDRSFTLITSQGSDVMLASNAGQALQQGAYFSYTAGFVLLTLATYGNGRITGAADVICLMLAF